MGRQHQRLRFWAVFPHPARDLGGSWAGHAQVEQQKLGAQLDGQLHRFWATLCLAHDLDIGCLVEDGADTRAHCDVIVGQYHTNDFIRLVHLIIVLHSLSASNLVPVYHAPLNKSLNN